MSQNLKPLFLILIILILELIILLLICYVDIVHNNSKMSYMYIDDWFLLFIKILATKLSLPLIKFLKFTNFSDYYKIVSSTLKLFCWIVRSPIYQWRNPVKKDIKGNITARWKHISICLKIKFIFVYFPTINLCNVI